MKNRPYRAVEIKHVDQEMLAERFPFKRITAAVDVAKQWMFVCLMGPHWDSYYVLKFDAHKGIRRFIDLLDGLPAEQVDVVLEPSGPYGDPLRHQVDKAGFEVHKMRANKCQAVDEVFDHVPSLHDGKAAYLLARLHLNEVSEDWKQKSEGRRAMQANLRRLERRDDQMNRCTGQLEGWLARHWPELTTLVSLTSASLLELLKTFGSPQAVADEPQRAKRLLERVSKGMLSQDKITLIISLASSTEGVEPIAAEAAEVRELAATMRQLQREVSECEKALKESVDHDEPAARLKEFAGLKAAVSVVALVGDPNDYGSADQYQKGCGLNLKERSSGKHAGKLKITKRGPGLVRKYLYLLACRKVRQSGCPYVRAWYLERQRRNGGCKLKALVAVMRKLIKALYHIGRGAEYEPQKLFDASRLDLSLKAA